MVVDFNADSEIGFVYPCGICSSVQGVGNEFSSNHQ